MLSLIVSASLFSLACAADTHTVKVGNDGYNFDPDTVKAAVGDTVEFEFYPMNHSIAEASYDKPCQPMSGGGDFKPIFSGFFPVDSSKTESDKMFSMMVNNTDPIWLYCSQASHCKLGQVMVINPKDGADQTLQKFKDASSKVNNPSSPVDVFGGVVIDATDDGDEPKSTKDNPGTPATATMSTSTSATHTSSTSANSPTKTSGAGKIGASSVPILLPMLLSVAASGIFGFLV